MLGNFDAKEAPQPVREMEIISWKVHLRHFLGSGDSFGIVLAVNLSDRAPLA